MVKLKVSTNKKTRLKKTDQLQERKSSEHFGIIKGFMYSRNDTNCRYNHHFKLFQSIKHQSRVNMTKFFIMHTSH